MTKFMSHRPTAPFPNDLSEPIVARLLFGANATGKRINSWRQNLGFCRASSTIAAVESLAVSCQRPAAWRLTGWPLTEVARHPKALCMGHETPR